MKILIAEDERVTRRSLQRELEGWGHDVVAASDGAEAWTEFQRQRFDMVVTDWEMPGVDGAELIARIRQSEQAGYAYLIMLTGRSEKSDLVAGMEVGADDFLAKPFDRDELRVRVRAGERIVQLERSLAMQNRRLQDANDRMQHDLAAAAKIQRELLPASLPEIQGVRFAWHYQPCDELAGDLLNVVPIDPSRVALYVADVSGHGVAASLVSIALHRNLSLREDQTSLIRVPSSSHGGRAPAHPRSVAAQLNKIYPMESNGGHFITLVYGVIDLEGPCFEYCCAGHPGPILARRAEPARSFDAPSHMIGIIRDPEYTDSRIELRAGDRVYIYSDGLIEARSPSQDLFGLKRLETVIDEARELSLAQSIDAIVDAAAKWQGKAEFGDDISIVALELGDL